MKSLLAILCLSLCGCVGIPDNVQPVTGFELDRYLGTWYELARLDNAFERGLERVTARYSLREDGGIRVINRGFDPDSGTWKEAEGRAYFVGDPGVGRLKVSFFGPFYGGYNVIALDREHYRYALVCGPDTSYLWLLARTPDLDPAIVTQLVDRAATLGFATGELIYVKH
jgi:apolipoprotein D and lipocalin family protein